ncbi:cell division protein FtsA [Erythrobacteraceae bacterium CFH 75059]|uniref:cell division protein FtsA n=1 Tax=Qipengyuania thermophila TaxID=2509361 RepID=UPI0010208E1A|nr:cell division protein FtsA [Qipengyuania thermophila]TCD06174.1 cell division protein FtsA [Erythrobacteraceae bacterium CFH 75059]
MGDTRVSKTFAAVDIGSFRTSAMIVGQDESGALTVLGSSHRASQGVRRGYVTQIHGASFAVRDAVERAEREAQVAVGRVWVGCSAAGLHSRIERVDIEIGGRRVEEEDIDSLLYAARLHIQPEGRTVLHAQPAHYTLDGAHGVAEPRGLHAETLGVDVHVMLADGPPVRNLIEAVQHAHLDVEEVVASPLAASAACLTREERELGVALVELGADVTNVSVHAAGMILGMRAIPFGAGGITDAVASHFGIRRKHAERLKCVSGSAIATPSDHKEMVCVFSPTDEDADEVTVRGADDRNRVPRAELVTVVTDQLAQLTAALGDALRELGFGHARAGKVVLTGGGAELAGIADYVQGALARPVRIGRPPALPGLPAAHAGPGFTVLAGLCLYAADPPHDIRAAGHAAQAAADPRKGSAFERLLRAVRAYF